MNAPDPPHWTLNSCVWCVSYNFGALGTVWLSYKTRCKMVVMVQKIVPRSRVGIFRNEGTRSTPLDPKKCFGAFHKILVHLGPFSWLTKLTAKLAELVQKFVPRSCVRIFRNERTRCTPLYPKLMFWCVRTILVHLGLFGWLTKLGAKWAEQVQKFVPRSRVRFFRNQCTQSTPWDPELMFWCILYNFGAFVTVWLSYETRRKQAELLQKFVPQSRIEIFRKERTGSTPLDPKLMFRCISYNFGALGTVWLSYKTRCKTVVMVQKFVPRSRVGIFHNERTRSTPLDP